MSIVRRSPSPGSSPKSFVRGLNFFAVCYGLRFANLQEFPPLSPAVFKVVLLSAGRLVGQFLHSLNVNPCTPSRKQLYAKKILMAAPQSDFVLKTAR